MAVKTQVDELLELYNLPVEELINISSKVTQENFKRDVEFCSIISARTGKCQEDCKYCSQSSHYRTSIECSPLISTKDVKKAALSAKDNGASRFCVVTSGTSPEHQDFNELLRMVELVANIDGLHSCSSLGILSEFQVTQLKDAGLERYNHNLNTCESYHSEICSTHTYQNRVDTVKLVQSYGIEACTGGIIGMGESRRQRVELAVELAKLNPVSVPVNFLHPIEGTPMEVYKDAIDEEEILKTLAIFRIALPKSRIRYAGGRLSRFSKKYQDMGIKAGVNALLVGNYLTTTGITVQDDMDLVKNNNLSIAND